jgi:hypothetical protein
MSERSVVVSDLHGHDEKFRKIVGYYGEDMHYVINGDMYDRTGGIINLMDMIRDLDADVNLGNHEYVLLGAVDDIDPERREAWQTTWLGFHKDGEGGYEDRTLDAYGLKRYTDNEDTAKRMRDRLNSHGHLAMLKEAAMYYEDDLVLAVHAGLRPEQTWVEQQRELDALAAAASARTYPTAPDQLFRGFLSGIMGTPRDLRKPLVTGHIHMDKPEPEQRRWPRDSRFPRRVLLASHLPAPANHPAFAYETWSGKVRGFTGDGVI